MDYVIECTAVERELIEKAAEPYGGDIGLLLTMIIAADTEALAVCDPADYWKYN